MADTQPPNVVEGATTGDVEDEIPQAKSAEDRKAASALAKLDAPQDEAGPARDVDQEAVSKAMKSLGGSSGSGEKQPAPAKNVKVDQADVALLVSPASRSFRIMCLTGLPT
jgi:hypothetical protein